MATGPDNHYIGGITRVGEKYKPMDANSWGEKFSRETLPKSKKRAMDTKSYIYQDYLFWHSLAKTSQAKGDCVAAYPQRKMAVGDWIASGNAPDAGHFTAVDQLGTCAKKKV
jgi:hypothetical protein